MKRLTNKGITPKLVHYETLEEAFSILKRNNNPGMVVFVFEDVAPENYYKVAYKLSNWRVKRITLNELERQFSSQKSTRNKRFGEQSNLKDSWMSFIEMIALDVLQ